MGDIKLSGRIIIKAIIEAKTGLHIGGSGGGLEIGGIDKAVIRDPLTNYPYIPGSSLRGKMRSQLEKYLGLPQNNRIGRVNIHTCKTAAEYDAKGGCPVCHIFGVPGEVEASGSTLLLVRDAILTEESAEKLDKAHTDFSYTELKTEVAIDRVTSAASPRNLERVPAGAKFGPVELVFNIYGAADVERFKYILDGLQLVEDDYLGGSGSRGSGKVQFSITKVAVRSSKDYINEIEYAKAEETITVQQLAQDKSFLNWLREKIQAD
ncbi:MAG: type III-A CRISPR-associated RAMP protein Csm3 [Chloroflexota bacterium]